MPLIRLTNHEVTIVKHLCQGKSVLAIAAEMNISSETVETHIKNILKKLELINTHQLIQYATTMGWTQ